MGGSDIAADDGNRLGPRYWGIAREKHNIKRADRLLSNPHLQSEREAMYRVLAQRLVGQQNIRCYWSIGQISTRGDAIR